MGSPPCNRLLVGVTGSVAATVMPQVLVFLRTQGVASVRVIMSRAACRFVTPYVLRLHSGRWVFTDAFGHGDGVAVPHVELPRQADLFLVMPATANILAKAAHGICDDLISTAVVACSCPVLFVPSMNEVMWRNPAVQGNVARCREHGYHVMNPVHGMEIADLEPIYGTMPPLRTILAEMARLQKPVAG